MLPPTSDPKLSGEAFKAVTPPQPPEEPPGTLSGLIGFLALP